MISAIITAGGKGLRMKSKIFKQYIKIKEVPILSRTIRIFESIDKIKEIIVVVPKGEVDFCRAEILSYVDKKDKIKIAEGGVNRQDSVYNGLKRVEHKNGIILIHDGVRPFVSVKDIKRCIKKAEECGAAILAVPITDTLKMIGVDSFIEKTVKRDTIQMAQTPQAFKYSLILSAYEKFYKDGALDTDDASKLERIGAKVAVVEGSRLNIKITCLADIKLAEFLADTDFYE
ncbi:MAG: 2-C-methyl-D-erythritol 4-phosphate cytidylyltransferase [Deltaproteobacteria bacterium]|nr:2-C-methyl-D-erythritol 4-phosphate cytidylyltransferase [Deltaproteobacteria bacterium]